MRCACARKCGMSLRICVVTYTHRHPVGVSSLRVLLYSFGLLKYATWMMQHLSLLRSGEKTTSTTTHSGGSSRVRSGGYAWPYGQRRGVPGASTRATARQTPAIPGPPGTGAGV